MGTNLRGLHENIFSSHSAPKHGLITHGSCSHEQYGDRIRVEERRFGVFFVCMRDLLYQPMLMDHLTSRRSSLLCFLLDDDVSEVGNIVASSLRYFEQKLPLF